MKRFLWGLFLGGASTGVTWWLSESPLWTAVVGVLVTAVIWFGGKALSEIAEAIGEAAD